MLRIRRLVVSTMTLLAVIALTVGMAQPAAAHDADWLILYRGEVQIREAHTLIRVCDTKADGIGVGAEWWTTYGHYYKMGDANGSKPGCGVWSFYGGETIDRFKGNAANGSTTGWRNP